MNKNSIEDCLFENNQFVIYTEYSGNISIIRSNFSNNFCSSNGGCAIYLSASQLNSLVEIADCGFIKNNSTNSGGAIYMQMYRNTSLINSNFSKNLASYGGAIALFTSQSNSFFEIVDCIFIENNSSNSGGAFYSQMYGNTSIIGSNFSNNFAYYFGGAILLFNSQSIFLFGIANCVFIKNNSTGNGGAMYLKMNGNTSIIRTKFSNNIATSYTGAILSFKSQPNSLFEIVDCVFKKTIPQLLEALFICKYIKIHQ